MACDQITREVAEAIRTKYLEGPTKHKFGNRSRTLAGCNTLTRYLKNVLTHAIGKCPFRLKIIKEAEVKQSYIPMDLVPAFLAEIDRTRNAHVSIAVRAMIYMGLRESEALNMRWDWLSPDLATYTPSLTKGKEAWDLPVHPDLQARLKVLPNRLGWVLPWVDKKGNALPHRVGFSKKAIQRASDKIAVAGLTPHSLRRTAATLMHQGGVGIKTIQRQLRHKNISTTMGYIQVGLEDLKEAQRKVWGS
jgi:integrase